VSPARGHSPLLGLLALLALLVALPAEAQKKPLSPGERVDLNSATAAELMRLPGVGKKRAEAIVAARDKRPFKKTDEVLRVKGVSPAWFSKTKGVLTVGEAPAPARPAEPTRTAKGG
jgi:competence protein ComEA